MDWLLLPLKRYADFSGRSRRMEYWMFTLLQTLIFGACFVLLLVAAGMSGDSREPTAFGWMVMGLMALVALALFIPALAVQVRRFHDQDISGWCVLLGFIPFVGWIIVLIFMCMEGTPGSNQYGPDPKPR